MLDRKGLGDASPGDLVVARRTRGRARVERTLGPSDRDRERPRGTARRDRRAAGLRAVHAAGHHARRPRRPTRAADVHDRSRDSGGLRRRALDRRRARLRPHRGRLLLHRRRGAARPRRRAARLLDLRSRAASRRCCRTSSRTTSAACGRTPIASCVTVELPHDGGEPSFYRSVIRSDARLSYGQAERILAGAEQFAHVETLRRLDERARELRHARFARGALRIQTPEIVFEFDGRGGVADARRQGEPEAHALVEEFMIRANEAVAELLASRNRPALYRVHERPEPQSIAAAARRSSRSWRSRRRRRPTSWRRRRPPRSQPRAAERIETYVAQSGRGRDAFPALILRSLKQARYDPRNLGHAGLASRAYCHFTSPIRRYPDLVCHRALLAEIGAADAAPPDDLGGARRAPSRCASARRRRSSTRPTRSASRGCSTRGSTSRAGRRRSTARSSA